MFYIIPIHVNSNATLLLNNYNQNLSKGSKTNNVALVTDFLHYQICSTLQYRCAKFHFILTSND